MSNGKQTFLGNRDPFDRGEQHDPFTSQTEFRTGRQKNDDPFLRYSSGSDEGMPVRYENASYINNGKHNQFMTEAQRKNHDPFL